MRSLSMIIYRTSTAQLARFMVNLEYVFNLLTRREQLKGIGVQREDLYVSDPRFLHEVLVKSENTVFRHPQYFYE